ncbi:MAG: carboxypeptidase-like regulatory domain-containing protein [Flavobacteriales bacterium]
MIFPKHITPGLKMCALAFLGLVVSSFCASSTLQAHEYFRAKVVDTESLLPVPGAHVMESPQGLRAVSDANGVFQFEAIQPGKHKFEFSAVGFEKKVIIIHLPISDTLIIKLKSSETILDEVVV